MTPETQALLSFDVDEVLAVARASESRRPPEDREQAALALERARLEAARFLLQRGSAVDRQLAARFAFRAARRAA